MPRRLLTALAAGVEPIFRPNFGMLARAQVCKVNLVGQLPPSYAEDKQAAIPYSGFGLCMQQRKYFEQFVGQHEEEVHSEAERKHNPDCFPVMGQCCSVFPHATY